MCRVSRHMGSHLMIKILIFWKIPVPTQACQWMKSRENNKSLLRRFTVTNFYALYLFLPSVQFLRIGSFFFKKARRLS